MSLNKNLNRKIKLPIPKFAVSKNELHISVKHLLLVALIFGGIGSYFIYRSFASPLYTLTFEAENLTAPTNTAPDGSGYIAFKTPFNGDTTAQIATSNSNNPLILPQKAVKFEVVAKGTACSGAPRQSLVIKANGTQIYSNNINASSWTTYASSINLPSGSPSLSIEFNPYKQFAGNSGNIKCSRSLSVDKLVFYGEETTARDNTPPSLGWTKPAEGATVSGYMFDAATSGPSGPCEVSASDNVGVTKVLFYIVDSTGNKFLNQESSAPYNCKFDTTTVPDGTYGLRAEAYDGAGNTNFANRTLIVSNGGSTNAEGSNITKPYGDAANLKDWSTVFEDQFKGTNADGTGLNTAIWTPSWLAGPTGYSDSVNSHENNCYSSEMASVSGGMLRLTVHSNTDSNCQLKNTTTRAPYVGGIVTTYGKFKTTHGYYEARINFPGGGGKVYNWPIFWTGGVGNDWNVNWPEEGEFDIAEGLGGRICYNYHHGTDANHLTFPGCPAPADTSLVWSGWHTYALHWQQDKITFYYDGKAVGTKSTNVVNLDHFLIFSNGTSNSNLENTRPNTTMEVDYIKVWK